jgi:hypothetical protein
MPGEDQTIESRTRSRSCRRASSARACLSAHFVSRTLRNWDTSRGSSGVYVKPPEGRRRPGDAEAIAGGGVSTEPARRPGNQDQLDLQACHRVRSRLVSPDSDNQQIRAFLIEQGIAVRLARAPIRSSLFTNWNRKDEISPRMAGPSPGLYGDWCHLDGALRPSLARSNNSVTPTPRASGVELPGIGR